MQGDIETYFEDGRWKNKVEGSTRATSAHDTKADAVGKGRDMARERKVEHFIRNQDGRIGERNTYGHVGDPGRVSCSHNGSFLSIVGFRAPSTGAAALSRPRVWSPSYGVFLAR
ncbi:DUF2188 domain-containing protein [Amycolatopsis sp. NPDC049868]|uniref:DUF2188 domain-containing protein n=1 Tax=Amycolatopsis sp. NPDC049868 TaxID=3363934 RepID=UPI00379AED0E